MVGLLLHRAGRKADGEVGIVLEPFAMNERQQSHIDFYLQRLEYWKGHKPAYSTARLLAARDADEVHLLRTEEGATEVLEHLWRLEREGPTDGSTRRRMSASGASATWSITICRR
jgi:hypothetical protein